METLLGYYARLGILGVILCSGSLIQVSRAAEFVLINRVISFDINAQDGFWYYDLNPSLPDNWLAPDNYYTGTFYTRYEIISVPTNAECAVQCGIFQYQGAHNDSVGELCETNLKPLSGVGDVVTNATSPSTWWKIYGGVDFSRIDKLQSLAMVLYSWDTRQPVCKPGQGADDDGETWSQRYNWFPITLRVTVIAVSSGSSFSGWDNYIPNPAIQKPTPNYSIDFINETTSQVVPSTDEFSGFPTMYGAVSGSGVKMPLTPGRDAYFRTKAGDGLKRSEIQHFDIPCRPATPVFKLDAVNNRTHTTVSNEYEYSDFSDMSDAVTGSGTYVSIPAGTTKYFRKKATVNSFKSNIQAVNASTVLPIVHEFLLFNGIVDFPNATDTNGFFYYYYNKDMPSNWLSPEDYYNGKIYVRYEVLSAKTTEPIDLQIGFWQLLPTETGELHETMSGKRTLYGAGTIRTMESSPSTWWKLDDGFDYTKMDLTWHLGINPWMTNTGRQIRQENNYEWSVRNTYFFPMKVYVTIVAVASGYNLSGWSNYLGLKAETPSYTVDYVSSKTSQVIPSTDEYSYSPTMSPAYSGTGAKLDLVPGQNVYFRTKANGIFQQSYVQRLIVPAKPVPSYSVDFIQSKTHEIVPSTDEYSVNADMSGAVSGTGSTISLTPGVNLYFRTKSGAGNFGSDIVMLTVPSAPAAPVFTINYEDATTNEIAGNQIMYATNAGFSSPLYGTGAVVSLTPGQNLYFKQVAGSTSFGSSSSMLVVPGTHYLGYSGNDTITSNKYTVYALLAGGGGGLSLDDVEVTNGTARNLRAGNVFDIYPSAKGWSSVTIQATDHSFASNTVSVYYNVVTALHETEADQFSIYPNPSHDGIIYLYAGEVQDILIEIYSADGHVVHTQNILGGGTQKIDLSHIPGGLYFMRSTSNRGNILHKLVLN